MILITLCISMLNFGFQNYLGQIRRYGIIGGGVSLKISKPMPIPMNYFGLMLMNKNVISHLLPQHLAYLHASCFCSMIGMGSHPPQAPNKPIFSNTVSGLWCLMTTKTSLKQHIQGNLLSHRMYQREAKLKLIMFSRALPPQAHINSKNCRETPSNLEEEKGRQATQKLLM